MRRPVRLIPSIKTQQVFGRSLSTESSKLIISIKDAVFYRQHPETVSQDAQSNSPLFPKLTFELPSSAPNPKHWAVIGPSSAGKTTFFEILRGQHLCFPPTARSFPYLSSPNIGREAIRSRVPSQAIRYVGFAGKTGGGLRGGSTAGAYLSARYESRREATDFSVLDYLAGKVELNPTDTKMQSVSIGDAFLKVIRDLKLESLVDMPVGNLSNGQTRRAKIAKALLDKPEVLLLDEPFMGLDPPTVTTLSPLLHNLAEAQAPRIMLSLRPQDPLPDWVTHVVLLDPELHVGYQGPKEKAPRRTELPGDKVRSFPTHLSYSREGLRLRDRVRAPTGEPIIEMHDVVVRYGDRTVLGNWHQTINGETRPGLHWTVRRGERWGIFGPNGSGKTTLLSLISSDHPQSYSLPIRLFSRPRLPSPGEPGISIFDLQSRIGHSSPELHAFVPKHLSLRRVLESAFADTFLAAPQLTFARDTLIDTHLKWFEPDLNPHYHSPPEARSTRKNKSRKRPLYLPRHGPQPFNLASISSRSSLDWADRTPFAALPFAAQRLALLLRALLKKPDLVVLDEAFSGMDAMLRDKALLFLQWGTSRHFVPNPYLHVDMDAHDDDDAADDKEEKEKGKKEEISVAAAAVVGTAGRVQHHRLYVVRPTPRAVLEALGEGAEVTGLEQRQALIVVSHVKDEVPGCVRDWMCLPAAEETGEAVRMGRLAGPLEGEKKGWERIWGQEERRKPGRPGKVNKVEKV